MVLCTRTFGFSSEFKEELEQKDMITKNYKKKN